MTTSTLLVRKDQLATTRLLTADDTPLAEGQVRVAIDAFALTSNNITYAAFGEAMNYWEFFPATDAGWGIVPVWGFGSVVQSLHPAVAVGERLYGYWPMASSAVLQPDHLSPAGFKDAAPHRAALHAVYNQYLRCSADPFYTAASEGVQALLRPLFITSWLIDDFLADNSFFGAGAATPAQPQAGVMLLSSASSKTAYGTAFQLSRRPGIEVVGLTSAAHKDFCESLGCYGRVLTYEQLGEVRQDAACVYIDFAGNASLRRDIHSRFSHLKYSCSIGGTHVEQLGGAKDLPGPRATLFFAPAQIKKRVADWGAAEFSGRLVRAWQGFQTQVTDQGAPWLTVRHHQGPQAVAAIYAQVLAGRSDPREGHILSMALQVS